MARPTKCYVDLNAFKKNIKNIKDAINTKVLVLVKANAYGHGLVEIADCSEKIGVDYLGVASVEEGVILRQNGITIPVLCLGPIPIGSEKMCVENDIDQAVSNIDEVSRLVCAAKELNKQLRIHIKIETGMHRTGVRAGKALDELLAYIKSDDRIVLDGVFTHFSTSDSADRTYTDFQKKEFDKAVAQVKGFDNSFGNIIVHCSNSGAILNYPEYACDMVRAGIMVYGCYPSKETKKSIKLYPVMSLKTAIVEINDLKAGECISYGATYTAKKDMRIAVLPIGYADGYKRLLSNRGRALINGKTAKIVGRVCMDMMMVDITDIDAQVGNEAVLIGKSGNEEITADEVANHAETISNELLTSFTSRVPRIYLNE